MNPKKILPTIKRVWKIDDNITHDEFLIAPKTLTINQAEAQITEVCKGIRGNYTAYDLAVILQRDHGWEPFEFELYDFDDHGDDE